MKEDAGIKIDVNILKEKFDSGESIKSISRFFNCSQSLVQGEIDRAGLQFSGLRDSKDRFKENKKYTAICRKTKEEFGDYLNSSGALTVHIKKEFPDYIFPTPYKRRRVQIETGKFWYEKFFYFKEEEKTKEKEFKCKYCDWTTVDLDNSSGWYTVHLKKEHGKSILTYLDDYPKESYKFKTFLNRESNKKEILKKENHVECEICNKKLRYITNTHLKKHGITPEEYKLKFGVDNYASKNFIDKTTKNLKEATKSIKNTFVSKPEKDLKKFIEEELGVEIIHNNRSIFGVEVDIVIESLKICIEFNGNLYHSENYGNKGRLFHLSKSKLCREKGYKLIHIMEDEWFLNNRIVKQKIKNILKIGGNKSVYARKCEIKEIDSKIKNEFLNNNHIQGENRCNLSLGAFYNDKLVSVITFSNNIRSNTKEGVYEITRFASDIELNVVGIFSKFISYFKRNYRFSEVFTFLDLRWNNDKENNLYAKNGFEITKTTGPDYTYYNSKVSRYKRFHKFGFSKASIRKRFPDTYDNFKTEWEMMQELGYDRIWDCGKYKFSMHYSEL